MYRNIFVAIDGSPASTLALKKAVELAAIAKARLCLFHALDELSISTALDPSRSYIGNWKAMLVQQGGVLLEKAAATAKQSGVDAETFLHDGFTGPVYKEVAEKARDWGADLIVAGTHGRRGIQRLLLGSCSEQIMRYATIPVLLVRMPESANAGSPAGVESGANLVSNALTANAVSTVPGAHLFGSSPCKP